MSKTIGEAARKYAEENWTDFKACEWPKEYVIENLEYAFEEGATHVLSLPFSQRLTDEEREKIRKMYESELEFARFYQRKANSCCNTQCRIDYEVARDIAKSRAGLLESIFGKELFGEE